MPLATEPQIALCNASALVLPQLPSSAPLPPRLMFATLMPRLGPFAATQSRPQITHELRPVPAALSTFTAYSGVLGATPTTPLASSLAPMVPATCEPCP